MCGIVGVAGFPDSETGKDTIERMNDLIIHRGPDEGGTWVGTDIAIGMRRLSIIDIEGGQQPLWSEDGVGIVFNGEIYNYKELRDNLKQKGYDFNTESDTEVILNLYRHKGITAINELDGMFAIAIVDLNRGLLHLVRDRFGKKPLYYGALDGQFYFASEIKSILAALNKKPDINCESLHHYLTLRYVPAPHSIWQGIEKLEPGCRLQYDITHQNWKTERYWQVTFNSKSLISSRDYVGEFETLFMGAVEKRVVASDVPVGVLLSGGLDSSIICAAVKAMGHKNFHTFSVGFEDGGCYNELSYARQVANALGTQHHEIIIGKKEFMQFLEEFTWYSDEPLADLASIPLYFVSKLARQHVKVVLSGEGADEVFAGYHLEKEAEYAERRRHLTSWIPRTFLSVASYVTHGNKSDYLKDLASHGWSGYVNSWAAHISNDWNEQEKQKIYKGAGGSVSTKELIKSWYDQPDVDHAIDKIQNVMINSWLVEDLLMKADKMSMATSLELRVPFLDHHLVEWAAELPLAWKVGNASTGYTSKRIVREFAKKYIPQEIIDRPKQGFPVPAYRWLKEGNMGSELDARLTKIAQWLGSSKKGVSAVLEQAQSGNSQAAAKIWNLIVLEYWYERWVENTSIQHFQSKGFVKVWNSEDQPSAER